MRIDRQTLAIGLGLAALLAAAPARAQFKVVAPDGSVTYTDRPPAAEPGRQVLPLRRDASAGSSTPVLPTFLRGLVDRFPVTLLTSADCAPCDSGRKLLQQRGVPYIERLVTSEEDVASLQGLSGGRIVPALTVGKQALRGFQAGEWQATLDLAGYPKDSRLPPGWTPPPVTPLAPRATASTPPALAARPPAEPLPPDESPTGEGRIRF